MSDNIKVEDGANLLYMGNTRRPYFQMRGKKITKDQAYEIIKNECYVYSYREDVPAPNDPVDGNMDLEILKLSGCNWIKTWVDFNGNVGTNDITGYKYPIKTDLIEEHSEIAKRYPFLEYVIIYSDFNEVNWDVFDAFNDIMPPFYVMKLNDFLDHFSYAIYVHEGTATVVTKETAIKLYNDFQSQYPSTEMFNRNNCNDFVTQFITPELFNQLIFDWKIKDTAFVSELHDLNFEEETSPNLRNWVKFYYPKLQDKGTTLKNDALNYIADQIEGGNTDLRDLELHEKFWDQILAAESDHLKNNDAPDKINVE